MSELGWLRWSYSLDLKAVCVPRRLQFWTLEFESQSFLYRQVGYLNPFQDGLK